MRRLVLPALILIALIGLPARTVHAANGDVVSRINFSQTCPFLGVGIAFDGTDLWYSCYSANNDLFRADPHTGQVLATYSIAGGLGALAYDSSRNALWAGWGDGQGNEGDVRLIQLDASENVASSRVVFNATDSHLCDLDDGLAYEKGTDTLYISPDCSTVIHHYSAAGTHLDDIPWAGNSCYNSGLAIGAQLLFEGSDGCNHVWVVNKHDNSPEFDFSTEVAGDPNFRDEGLACDPVTFASQGKHVIWSMEAYEPRRATAFEIPFGSCGAGGGDFPSVTISKTAPQQAFAGTAIPYTLTYDNIGHADAANVSLTDTLPSGLTYVQGSGSPAPSVSGNTLTWTVGTLAAGTKATISFQATADSSLVNSDAVNCATLRFTDTYSITKSFDGCATTAVKQPPRQITFVHGINGNFRTIQDGQDWKDLIGPLGAQFSKDNISIYSYFQDVGYALNPDARPPQCSPLYLEGPDLSGLGTIPIDTSTKSIGSTNCDSQSDLGIDAGKLDTFLKALAKPAQPIAVIANSMGGAITRGWLALAQRKQDKTLTAVDTVIFLHGAQQGSYLAEAAPGLEGTIAHWPIVGPIIEGALAQANFYDRPAAVELAPRSTWYRNINSTDVPAGMHYFNFYTNIQVETSTYALFWKVASDTEDFGDTVMLPGSDSPTAVPKDGGARFLPGGVNVADRYQWAINKHYDVVNVPSEGLDPVIPPGPALALADPANHFHIGENMNNNVVQVADCTTGEKITPTEQMKRILANPAQACGR